MARGQRTWADLVAAAARRWDEIGRPLVPSYEIDYEGRKVVVEPSAGRAERGGVHFAALGDPADDMWVRICFDAGPERLLAYAVARDQLIDEGWVDM